MKLTNKITTVYVYSGISS